MSAVARPIFLGVAWFVWLLPFFIAQGKGTVPPVRVERRARWGILLEAAGFCIVFTHGPRVWSAEWPLWRLAIAAVSAAAGIALSWTAVRNLGRQWRIDAGLNADHELVRTGPYRMVRHPIYASMLAMLLAGVAAAGTLPGWPMGLAFYLAGTEIRIRVEDGLLRSRFGAEFEAWRLSVPAYIPFLR
ncbi:MAG: isoprenylcysteine carboxylmethyltransferase family protein [Acidobacteriota bacterium]|nr:isoprenylcysteine carboxylmethyltransferase family protein [Acidobacteriota bacterium]